MNTISDAPDIVEKWNVSEAAAKLHREACICDMTLPWVPEADGKEEALQRFRNSGFNFLSLSVGVERMGLGATLRYLLAIRDGFKSQPGKFKFVYSVEDIRDAHRNGKLAIGFHFQGSEMLERDTRLVEVFYDLGIRHMLIAKDYRSRAADGCYEKSNAGLSRFGIDLIREMNRVGMVLDLTHTGYASTMEAMDVSTEPVIFSHSNPQGVLAQTRNIKDDQIRGCAKSGGVVGIVGFGHFLKDTNVTAQGLFENVDYVSQLVGAQHAALGLDYVYYPDLFLRQVEANPGSWPPEYMQNMKGFNYVPPEALPELTELMLSHGYSDEDAKGVLGENFLRVCQQVWK
ncbi:dipeptidase [Hoeflea sp. WL0058]|uniref:Dipeptidase n=1 Tax=Flavimaribacter sediminis TaxID=2865987 RepID=A0AAE3CZI4_9HYPH|nr:membrane dipeptidase [Flavimaribacter sediminis]MBW8635858.1 dipeptidase [Flavimaribacter sediminis]